MPVELEIVSPERLLLSRPVEMVVVPGSEGDIGVLQGHTPMIVMLRGGTIELYEGNRVTDRLFVAGGFCEITPERCTVLADEALPLDEVSRSEAERADHGSRGRLCRPPQPRAGRRKRPRSTASNPPAPCSPRRKPPDRHYASSRNGSARKATDDAGPGGAATFAGASAFPIC